MWVEIIICQLVIDFSLWHHVACLDFYIIIISEDDREVEKFQIIYTRNKLPYVFCLLKDDVVDKQVLENIIYYHDVSAMDKLYCFNLF